MNQKRRIVVGISGASGTIYGIRLIEILSQIPEIETHLILSKGAELVMKHETPDLSTDDLKKMADFVHDPNNMAAPIASGSFLYEAMVVAPCSMKTLSCIASGITLNLLLRACDVCLKQGRKIILMPRESPLSAIHLENMLKLARLGVHIVPPIPGFYVRPKTVDDIINFSVGRILDLLEINHELFQRWGEKKKQTAEQDGSASE